jgi:hypothetical protein
VDRHIATGDDEAFDVTVVAAVVASRVDPVSRDDDHTLEPAGGITHRQVPVADDKLALRPRGAIYAVLEEVRGPVGVNEEHRLIVGDRRVVGAGYVHRRGPVVPLPLGLLHE